MTKHMEYEDACPALVIMPIERVLIGDTIWGFEQGGNYARKGWTLLSEPETVNGYGLQDLKDYWKINANQLNKKYCRYVLIPKPEPCVS